MKADTDPIFAHRTRTNVRKEPAPPATPPAPPAVPKLVRRASAHLYR